MNKTFLVIVILFALTAGIAVSAFGTALLPPNPWPRYNAQAVWANGQIHWVAGATDKSNCVGFPQSAVALQDKAGNSYDFNRQSGYSIYNPTTNTWQSSKWDDPVQVPAALDNNMDGIVRGPEGIRPMTSQSFAYNDDDDSTEEIFIHAGYPEWDKHFFRYDPDTNSWSKMGTTNGNFGDTQVGGVSAIDKTTGTVWAACGRWNGSLFAKYEFATDTWTNFARTPFTMENGVGAYINGTLIVATGMPSGGTGYSADIWECNTTTNPPTWSSGPVATLPKAIVSASVSVYNNKMYIIGGIAAGSDITDIYSFDPATNVVTKVGDLPVAMSQGGGVISPDGILYVGEGRQAGSFTSTKWWKSDLKSTPLVWTPIADDPAYFPYNFWDPGGEMLTGRVLDPAGKPLAGALVGIKKAGTATADARYYAITDMTGTFSKVVAPGNWNIAAWGIGFAPSADVAFTMGTEPQTIADVQITDKACANIAPTATTTYFSSETSGEPAANAIDNKKSTRWSSAGDAGIDQYYIIDFGAAKDITGAVAYWELARPAGYTVDITTGDPNPAGSATWTPVYICQKGTGGWDTGTGMFVDPIRFDGVKSARGVRFHLTSVSEWWQVSYSAFELQVLGNEVLPTSGTLAEAKQLNDGDAVMISKPVTVSGGPLGNDFYIEETDRSNGIRVIPAEGVTTVAPGYLAEIIGTMTTTPEGERAIAATSTDGWFPSGTPAPLGMNNKTALGAMATGLLIKPWGKVKSIGDKFFMLDDGSDPNAAGVKVYFDSTIQPEVDSFLSFEGVPSKEAGNPIIIATKIDLTSGSIVGDGWIKAWLLNGYYQVADPGGNNPAWQVANLANDFLTAQADGGETGIKPFPGKISNTLPWSVYSVPTGTAVPLDTVFAGQTNGQKSTYAFVYLYSPETYDGWPKSAQLCLGSDDGSRAWVNGELVHSADTVQHTVTQDQYKVLTTLHQGWNTLLLKINNIDGSYGFCARMMADDGTGTYVSVPGMKFSLYPQE